MSTTHHDDFDRLLDSLRARHRRALRNVQTSRAFGLRADAAYWLARAAELRARIRQLQTAQQRAEKEGEA